MILRDAIHKDIYLNENEKKVIDTAEMQRLRGIKQLGTANLVYPTALHTRFDHSIGVNAVTKKILHELNIKEKTKKIVNRSDTSILQITSLLHDITHIPFGHTFEDEMLIFDKHDKKDRYVDMLNSGEIRHVLDEIGISNETIEILSSKDPEQDLDYPWHSQIIVNTICGDILDYLKRDIYFCGLNKDYDDRIFKYFDLQEKDGKTIAVFDLTKGNMLRNDALTELIHILRLRYYLAERVYLHHTKVCSGAMLAKALNIAKNYGVTKEDLKLLSDEQLIDFLLTFPSEERPNKEIFKLVSNVVNRQLLKRAYVLSPESISHRNKRNKLIAKYHEPEGERERNKREEEIAESAKVDREDIIIYCMGDESLKEAEVYVKVLGDNIQMLKDMPYAELKGITESYENLWKLYVFAPKDKVTKVHDICVDIFEKDSEYSPKHYRGGLDSWIAVP